MDHPPLKSELRKSLLAKRNGLRPEEITQRSSEIFLRWRNRFSLRQVAWLHLFQSIPRKNEVQTHFFADYLEARHARIKIVVPVMDAIHKKLRHALIENDIVMETNRFGVPEPRMPVRWVYPMLLDMVLVPLLGFDERGNRLGYGGGYYDRFLHNIRPQCLKIGLAFELSHLDAIPVHAHDVPLDFVVTEAAVYRCNPNLSI
ncbi:MAG: 5-formyltetrahydrofolate cyclo-ligase [Bacteroidota bacterium]